MENRANYALVGLFATIVLVAVLGFVYWFMNAGAEGERRPYAVVFEGAVTGLAGGTDVLFNGLRVGTVTHVGIDPADPTRVIARIAVDQSAPIRTDTRAILEIQAITGGAHIQLLGGSPDAPVLVATGDDLPMLRGEPSSLDTILQSAGSIVESAESAFNRLDGFLADNEARLGATLANIETLSNNLAGFAGDAGEGGGLDEMVTSLQQTIESANATFVRIEDLVETNAPTLTAAIDGASRFSTILAANADGIDAFLAGLGESGQEIGPLTAELRGLSSELRELVVAVTPEQVAASIEGLEQTIASANSTFARIDELVTGNADSFAASLGNLEAFSRTLADNSEGVDAFLVGLSDASDHIAPIAAQVETLAADLGAIAQAFSPDQINASLEGLDATIANVNSVLGGLDVFVEDNVPSLTTTLHNLERFSQVLASNQDDVNLFLTALGDTADEIGPLATEIRLLATDVRAVVDAVPPESVAQTFADVSDFASTLARNTDNIDTFFADAGELASNLTGVSQGLQDTLELIDSASEAIDPAVIARAMDNLDAFSLALGNNAGNIDRILSNTRSLTDTLTGAAERIDTIIERVDGLVATEGGESMFEDISATAASIRALAEQLQGQATEVSGAFSTFANRGLDDYSRLASEARDAVAQLQRVLALIERNPQVVIFGGDTVRDFQR